MSEHVVVNGVEIEVPEGYGTLLDLLRAHGVRSPKDGCSPQGQCGCCTVLVDGAPRVACVTPARRVAGRSVTTVEGLAPEVRDRFTDAFLSCGASQCGFCTPGIVLRLAGLDAKVGDRPPGRDEVGRALAAHLCRCTGWQTIEEAADAVAGGGAQRPGRDLEAASARATLELGAPQRVDAAVVLGAAGFSADTAPPGCLVAMQRADDDEWVVAGSVAEARELVGKVQGRRTTVEAAPPIQAPPGEWDAVLRTSWVDPAYLETDAAWCEPGGEPSPAAANGGAFGGKRHSPLPAVARELADRHARPVLAVWSREDCARRSPKRPPVAGGARSDGTGVLRIARTPGIVEAVAALAPGLTVEEVDVAGPPTSAALRAAGWAEAAVLLAGAGAATDRVSVLDGEVRVTAPGGGVAAVRVDDGLIRVRVRPGTVLDEVVLRSYCIGAAHMGLSWVTSESLTVGPDGEVLDLTVRSFGVLRALDTPTIEVVVDDDGGEPVAVSPAVFAATAAAVWRSLGCPADLPAAGPSAVASR